MNILSGISQKRRSGKSAQHEAKNEDRGQFAQDTGCIKKLA